MKAVVLAAGEGERLEPLTNRRPKPMLPVANRPLLEYVVTAVADAGIEEVVLVVGYKRDRIQTYFGDGNDWGVSIEYAIQEKQLGTGHAVLQAEPFVEDEPFLVLNGDCILESRDVSHLVDEYESGDEPVLSITRSAEPSEYGVVSVRDGVVTEIVEKPHDTRSDLINAGVYGFDPSVFDAIRSTDVDDSGEYAITTTIADLVREGTVRAVHSEGSWIDVSNLWDVVRVNSNRLDRPASQSPPPAVGDGTHTAAATAFGSNVRIGTNSTIRHGTAVGPNTTVGSNVVLENAVVFADAVIDDGAVCRDCVVASNAHVGANATIAGGETDVVVGDEVHRDVSLGAVVGDNAAVGAGSVLEAGTIVGDDATTAPGTTLSGRVPTGATVRRG